MMLRKLMAMFMVIMLLGSVLALFVPQAEASESGELNPIAGRWKDAGQSQAYISGKDVLTYDRVILLKFNLSSIGGNKVITDLELTVYHTYATATGVIDVFAIPAFNGTGFSTTTFTDAFINSNLPEDGHAFQLSGGSSPHTGNGSSSTWQDQYDNDGYIYIGLALWNTGSTATSYGIDLQNDVPELIVSILP